MATRRGADDEQGAVAILVALLALVVLGVGAFAVDMGQVYAKRAALQSNVDLAALAAAAELDSSGSCNAEAVDAAAEYLQKNWIDAGSDPLAVNLTGAATDGDGYIECSGWKVRLWAPRATVEFGLAKAFIDDDPSTPEATSVDVPAYAAASVGSPSTGVMPAFAVAGCDYGPQTLLDNSPGPAGPVPVPALQESGTPDTSMTIDALPAGLTPSVIAVDEVTGLIIEGNNALENAAFVAFSTSTAGSNLHVEVPVSTAAKQKVTLTAIPSSVTSVEDIWYVRVSQDGTKWSDPAQARALQVGAADLECEPAPTDGNFGALLMYRDPDLSTNERLAMNMAVGLDFTVTTFPVPAMDWECTDGLNGAVESTDGDLKDGTNCVDTDTGFPASAAEAGLLTGNGLGVPGRLENKPTNPLCSRPDTTIDFGGSVGSHTVNNETLTCFFTNGTTQIDAIGDGYAGPSVISEEIFKSPRFFWVPVFGKEADSGGSDRYQIIDFRPGFLTDQASTASRTNPQVDVGGTENGLGLADLGGGKKTLRSLKIVFFDVDALPLSLPPGGPVVPYLGVGPKIISLVE